MTLTQALVLKALIEASALSGLPIPKDDQVRVYSAHEAFGMVLEHGTYGVTNWAADSPLVGAVAVSYQLRDDAFGYCVLVHELTHHLQWVDHEVMGNSTAPYEVQAWNVTAKCFEQNGKPEWAPWARSRAYDYALKIIGGSVR